MENFIKTKKKIFFAIIVIVMIIQNITFLYGSAEHYQRQGEEKYKENITSGTEFNPGLVKPNKDIDTNFKNAVENVWTTVLRTLQIIAVAGLILAGVRYMFASADTKSEIKKEMIPLVIGLIIVFATSTVVDFIVKSFDDIIK